MPPELYSFLALAMGFSVAGMFSTGYQLVAAQPASFRLLTRGPSPATVAAVPFLVFAAPFIIVRQVVRGGMAGQQRVELVLLATVVAGVWSLMSGTVVMMVLKQLMRHLG
jgi:hypothetical protein